MATAEPPAKRARSDPSSSNDAHAPYELLYWPKIPGRGEFVRLAFEATGTPYTDVSNASPDGIKELMSYIRSSGADASSAGEGNQLSHNPPPFAPPLLRRGSLLLSQTPAILLYLAPRLGLVPDPEEDPTGAYHIHALALAVLDGLSNEPHDVHHPVATSLAYEEQKEEALRAAESYRKERVPKWLGYLDKVLQAEEGTGQGKWLYGSEMSYADLVLFQALDGTMHAFPNCMQRMREGKEFGRVFALYDRVHGLERIEEYLGSSRRNKYGNGIWRHYPELDG